MKKLWVKTWNLLQKIWRNGNRMKYGNDETPDDTYFAYYIGISVFIFIVFFLMIFLL